MDETAALVRRLRWRCRRGTRELDVLLGGWLDRYTGRAATDQLEAFDALLQQQDPDLQDWLLGRGEPPRADWGAIVDDIRRHAGDGG